MLLFPLWSVIASILYQPVSSAVTYDRFQFSNEVSKKKKKNLGVYQHTVFHGCHWIQVLLHPLQFNRVVYHHPLFQYTDMLQMILH